MGRGSELVAQFSEACGEYVCRVESTGGREEMTAVVEVTERPEGLAELRDAA